MALEAKNRFCDKNIKYQVFLNKEGNPSDFTYRDATITTLGVSLKNDLIPEAFNNAEGGWIKQFVGTDKKGNLYEYCVCAKLIDSETNTLDVAILAIKSVPPK